MKTTMAPIFVFLSFACITMTVESSVLKRQSPEFLATTSGDDVPCEMFGGLLAAKVSPTCCFSVNVVAQRGLAAFGVAKPCREAWDCGNGTSTPTATFERKAVQAMCSEEKCVEKTKAAMKENWMTARGADKLGSICEKTAGGTASNPYPSGPALKALLHGAPCDTQSCKDDCKKNKCANQAATDKFCAYDGRAATNVNDQCYETCCVPNSASSSKGGMACFPGQAEVQTPHGSMEMSELRVGHEILVETPAGLEFAPVLSFLHTVPAYKTNGYLSLVHEQGELRVSENHVVFLCNEGARSEKRAGEIVLGDLLCGTTLSDPTHAMPSKVLKVKELEGARGMFAPLTSAGTLVVDGAVASNYATPNSLPIKHSVMHTALLPLRAYYEYGLDVKLAPMWSAICGLFSWNVACSAEHLELHPYVSFFHETAHLEKLATLL